MFATLLDATGISVPKMNGKSHVEEDVFHFNVDGQIKLGKIAASAID